MSSAEAQVAYRQSGALPPMEAQYNFAQQYDLQDPDKAKYSYQRIMHQHTKQQFEMASASSRRRSTKTDAQLPSMAQETSRGSISSVGSTDSDRSTAL